MAIGYNHTPVTPDWPGLDGFTGDLVLARDNRNGRPFAGRNVLVVGTGNTGTQIATDLAEHGATRVRAGRRTPPHIIPSAVWGWPAQGTGILVGGSRRSSSTGSRTDCPPSRNPTSRPTGPGRAGPGRYWRVLEGRVPVQDVGIVDAIRTRRVEPVAAVERFDGDEVVLSDGTTLRPGRRARRRRVPRRPRAAGRRPRGANGRGLPVVHGAHGRPGAQGLWFTGFTNPISGMLRELRIDGERIAAAVSWAGEPSQG